MTVFDVGSMLSTVTWSDEQLYLKEFVHKHELPTIVRIIKGQYLNLGVPSLSNPSLQATLLVVGLGKKKRIVGQSVKFKDNHKVVAVGPKLAVPSGYDGFFEILSEDGRSVKCIESVAELVRRFPDSVLVRENVKAFVSKSDDVQTIQEKSRIVETGETLILVGEVSCNSNNQGNNGAKFLRCLDRNGENIYLPSDLKCKFSAIAKEDNISGVHSAENLLNKRLPLMARLVHGLPPQGLKSSQQFAPEMRMFAGIDEECLVAMTLSNSSKEPQIIALPLPATLKVQFATNMSSLSNSKEFQRLKERCLDLSRSIEDKILIHDIVLGGRDLRLNGSDNKQRVNLAPAPTTNIANPLRRTSNQNGSPTSYPPHMGDDYDEIEQIYDYVRGFAPLPKGARAWKFEPPKDNPNNKPSAPPEEAMDKGSDPPSPPGTPPEPPPLETLPSRKGLSSTGDPSSSPPWSGNYGHIPANGGHHIIHNISENIYSGCVPSLSNKPEAKKRQRRSGEKSNENRRPCDSHMIYSTPALVAAAAVGIDNHSNSTPRFIKSANYRNPTSSGGYKLRFFRNKSVKETPTSPTTLRRSSILEGSGYCLYGLGSMTHPHGGKSLTSPSPVFNMRYKSMTNLATAGMSGSNEYDTLDSSGSGGKTTSGDSGGGSSSRNQLPEKRSRKLSRPKSLTNLVWSGLRPSSSKQSLAVTPQPPAVDQKKRLEPGVYTHRRLSRDFHVGPVHHHQHAAAAAAAAAHSKKMGGSKRIGTLYL